MAHTVEHATALNRSESRSGANTDNLGKLYKYLEFNRYGVYAILLLWNMCLGGIAVGLGAMTSAVELSVLVVSAMTLLSLILAVQPMKWVIWTAAVATVIDLIVIVMHLF